MPALSFPHGTAFRLLRVGALIVACLVFLWGCEVSRSATLGDVPEYLVLAGLAAVGGLVAAWFEIRAVRAGRRTVTMDDGRWRVVARVAGDGALVFVGHDEEPADSDDPEDAPSGWVWTFPAESIDAVRGVLAGACFPDDDPGELAELELLDLLTEAAEVLDPVARADPGAWLHGHGVRGERHEWGVDPTRTTRTLPIVGTPLAAPGRGAKRRRADASPAPAGDGRAADARRAAGRGSADGGARPGGRSSSRSARPGAGSASRSAEPKRRSARPRDAGGPGGRPERSARSAADREAEPEARARRGDAADRGSRQPRGESAARADSRRNAPAAGRESRRRGHEAARRGESPTDRRRGSESAGRGEFTADRRRGGEAPGRGEFTVDRRRGGEAPGHGESTADHRRGHEATGHGESAADHRRGGESTSRARGGTSLERDSEAATDRTVSRRDRGAASDRAARRSADRTEPPGEYQARDAQYSGPIRRRGVGRQQRPDAENWWETADGPTDRTYREPPPPHLSDPRRRRDD